MSEIPSRLFHKPHSCGYDLRSQMRDGTRQMRLLWYLVCGQETRYNTDNMKSSWESQSEH